MIFFLFIRVIFFHFRVYGTVYVLGGLMCVLGHRGSG